MIMERIKRFIPFLIIILGSVILQGQKKTEEIDYTALMSELEQYTPSGREPKVLVTDFVNDSFFESDKIGRAVAQMMETVISKSKRFYLVDRSGFDGSNTDREYYLQYARAAGADFIFNGSITEFGIRKTGTTFSTGASDKSSGIGGGVSFQRGKGTARLVLDLRIISVSTGEVIKKETGLGTSSSNNAVFGFEMLTFDDISTKFNIGQGVQGFDETLAGQAARNACIESITKIVRSIN